MFVKRVDCYAHDLRNCWRFQPCVIQVQNHLLPRHHGPLFTFAWVKPYTFTAIKRVMELHSNAFSYSVLAARCFLTSLRGTVTYRGKGQVFCGIRTVINSLTWATTPRLPVLFTTTQSSIFTIVFAVKYGTKFTACEIWFWIPHVSLVCFFQPCNLG